MFKQVVGALESRLGKADRNCFSILASSSDTVVSLKWRLIEIAHVEIHNQSLFFNGEMMENSRTLRSYSVPPGGLILMRVECKDEDDPSNYAFMCVEESPRKETGFAGVYDRVGNKCALSC